MSYYAWPEMPHDDQAPVKGQEAGHWGLFILKNKKTFFLFPKDCFSSYDGTVFVPSVSEIHPMGYILIIAHTAFFLLSKQLYKQQGE